MQIVSRTFFALLAVTLFASWAHAADPGSSPKAEAQAIQGDEGKSDPGKPGPGGSDASSPAAEAQAIQGGETGPASKAGGGASDASSPKAEADAIQGDEDK
jgi:hypothetical protein